ncbi:MAG: thioredoxin family protein [Pirellulaceae bacterium]|nr:thioredoxin family protein [Pirellulaceae bacterium]
MASNWTWRLGLSAFVFAALAVLAWSLAHQRGRIASRSQSVASRYAVHVTDATLQREVIEARLPVLVMFHAPWCQPCHEMMPTLDTVAESFGGNIKLVLINGDEQEFCRQKYSIDRYPTTLVIGNGQEVFRLVGLLALKDLARQLETVIRDLEIVHTKERETRP